MLTLRRLSDRWEDGQRVEKPLHTLDRWEVHASDDITVTAGGIGIRLQPQPQLISAARVGVGAALWDSALVLTAYLGVSGVHKTLRFC